SPALLPLLALGLCCAGIHGQSYKMKVKFRGSSTTHPQVGQRLELECLPDKEDSGVFWVRQSKDGTLDFIVFINSLSRTTFKRNKKTFTHFKAGKDTRSYWLAVDPFTSQDEGNYFCLMNSNQMLYFSPGQPVFFPVTTTVAPTTPTPTTHAGTTKKDSCLMTPDQETSRNNFFCDIFIWVPLAGACLLLVIALAITIMLCQQTRRRRCRCKR
ncbi:CD8A protein, partial [Nyctiprogne leucopyga]|nr:CD8A protein [Nyctiprogne leucopyga]